MLTLCGGCGPEEHALSASHQGALESAAAEAPSAWLPELPATFSSVTTTASIEVKRCTFTIGTALEAPPFPPVYHAWLGRQGCGGDGFVVVGSSYTLPATLLAGNQKALVGVFSFKETPSGAAYQKARVLDVDPASGLVHHAMTLIALPPSGTGVVDPQTLQLRHDGTVLLGGQKYGVIPGEVGSGSAFVAVWRKLVRADELSPPPTEVTAF